MACFVGSRGEFCKAWLRARAKWFFEIDDAERDSAGFEEGDRDRIGR